MTAIARLDTLAAMRLACGSALLLLPLAMWALVGCETRVSLGDRCASTAECSAGLRCELGLCRALCTDDAQCGAGARCIPIVGGGGVCTLPADDAGMADAAVAVADAGPFVAPTRCASASECPEGDLCADDFGYDVCRTACTTHDDCVAPAVCDWYRGPSGDPVFGCSTVCRPGTREGCPSSTTCRWTTRDNQYIREGPLNVTVCSPITVAGGDGCPCENLASSQECGEGLLCLQLDATERRCVRMCADGDECAPGVPCVIAPGDPVVAGVAYGTCPAPSPLPSCP